MSSLKKKLRWSYRYWDKQIITCPHCVEKVEKMLFKEFRETHSRSEHGLNEETECIFCGSYRLLNSTRDDIHRKKCFESFKSINKKRPKKHSSPTDNATAGTSAASRVHSTESVAPDLCECKSFDPSLLRRKLKHRVLDTDLQEVGFYDNYPGDFRALTNTGSLYPFNDESNLGREAAALFRLYFSNSWTIYHVYIRSYAFASFKQKMSVFDEGQLVVSTFWCLCDGCSTPTKNTIASNKLHRHMIVAVQDRAAYLKVWRSIEQSHAKERYCKGQKKIMSPMHLANTIHYVSSEKAQCSGSQKPGVGRGGHFYINRPLHEHSIMSMASFWRHGVMTWLNGKLKDKLVLDWKCEKFGSNYRKYRVKVSEIMKLPNCCIQLRWDWAPHPDGDCGAFWFENDMMRVQPTGGEPTFSSHEQFMMFQIQKGNSLRQRMENAYYTLNKPQARQMSVVEYMREKQRVEMQQFNAENVSERHVLKRRIDQLETEVINLKRQKQDEIESLERKIATLERERIDSNEKIAALEQEMVALRNQAPHLHTYDINVSQVINIPPPT